MSDDNATARCHGCGEPLEPAEDGAWQPAWHPACAEGSRHEKPVDTPDWVRSAAARRAELDGLGPRVVTVDDLAGGAA